MTFFTIVRFIPLELEVGVHSKAFVINSTQNAIKLKFTNDKVDNYSGLKTLRPGLDTGPMHVLNLLRQFGLPVCFLITNTFPERAFHQKTHGSCHGTSLGLKGHYMGLNLPRETAKFGRPTRRQHHQYLKISC